MFEEKKHDYEIHARLLVSILFVALYYYDKDGNKDTQKESCFSEIVFKIAHEAWYVNIFGKTAGNVPITFVKNSVFCEGSIHIDALAFEFPFVRSTMRVESQKSFLYSRNRVFLADLYENS